MIVGIDESASIIDVSRAQFQDGQRMIDAGHNGERRATCEVLHVDFDIADIDIRDIHTLGGEFGTLPFEAVTLSRQGGENRGCVVEIMVAVPPPPHTFSIELKHFRGQPLLINDRHGVYLSSSVGYTP